MAWFGLAKIALQAGGKIYANRQRTKMAMSDAQLMHAQKMASGEEQYQGKLLEARQNDYKDEIVLCILTLPIIILAWGVWTDDPAAMDNESKRKSTEQKINLDRMRAMMNQGNVEDKLDQNEDLAELRADTSLEKQEMANANRLKLTGMKTKTNGRSN